ncbi:MAG: molybdopterin-dependent oxidoreductase [Pseudonocardia sp.]|nr:molybdopterin-dependent oxidoreductase [Pseudonocardia sp.]
MLAVGAALGVGHLVAGIISPSSSPYLAVGDTVIRYSPEPVTEFAKVTFGTADKPILLGGMAVVILLVAALAGIASRRSRTPGVVVVTVLGIAGFAAVAFAPSFAPLDLVAPLASLLAGVASFRWLHRLALDAAADRAVGRKGGGVSRRNVLIGSSAAVGVAALASGGGGLLLGRGVDESRSAVTRMLAGSTITPAPPIPAGADFAAAVPGTTRFLTSNADFYRIDVALRIPQLRAEDWRLRIHGMVDREITLTFDDLLRRPLVERTITMTCVSNPIGGDLISTADFVGVDLRDILLEAGVQPGADQVFCTSTDGWTAGTPTDVVLEPGRGAMLAIGMNGEALPPEHGFPVRMIVPGLYGYVSATKWLTDMEITTFGRDRQAYWLQRGWAERGPIKTEARIDVPKGFSTTPAGPVDVAGIAWSQPRGISKVEVRMDGGAWQAAELATEVAGQTWRMWRARFDLAAGSHTVQVRATDADGATQTEQRADPVPDGATGWPATIFTVS